MLLGQDLYYYSLPSDPALTLMARHSRARLSLLTLFGTDSPISPE
jgi:hypothetical protein